MGHGERRRELERQFPGWRSGTCRGSWMARPGALVRGCCLAPGARRIWRLLSGLRRARWSRIRCCLPPRRVTRRGCGGSASRRSGPGAARRRAKARKGGGFPAAGGRSAWRGRAVRPAARGTARRGPGEARSRRRPRPMLRVSAGEVTAVDRCGVALRRRRSRVPRLDVKGRYRRSVPRRALPPGSCAATRSRG